MEFNKNFEKIKKAFLKADKSALTKDFKAQINLTDENGGGAFYIIRDGGVCSIEPYDYKDHTVMIDIKAGDMVKLIQGKLDIANALAKGEIRISGSSDHAKLLTCLAPQQKSSPKKQTKKKATKIEEEIVNDVIKDKKPTSRVVKKETE